MPHWFYASCVAISLVLAVFSASAFARAFGKKILSGYVFLMLIAVMVLSLVGLSAGGLSLVSQYSSAKSYETVYPLMATSGSIDLDMKVGSEAYVGFHFGEDISFLDLQLESTESETGSIVIRETFHTRDEQTQELLRRSIAPIQVSETPGRINISLSGSQTFTSAVPFAFPERTIIVRMPKHISLKIHGYTAHISGIAQSELDRYIPGRCESTGIRYSESKRALECDPAGYTAKNLKEGYVRYIEDHFNSIVGKQSVDFPSVIEWKDGHTVLVRYADYLQDGRSEQSTTVYITHDTDGDIQAKLAQ